MTAEMETALRQVLAEQAAEAPDGARLLAGVHARRRGLALRHRLIALSVAALTAVVAAGASLAGLQLAHRRDNVSSGALAGGLVPVPANWFPAFPVTPGWLPPGLGPARTGYTSHEQIVRLTYVDPTDRARYPDVVRAVHIGVSRTRLFPVQRAVRRAINIGGQSVTAFSGPFTSEGGHGVEVAWERRPGQWVHLQCDSTLGTFENVRRIAESLRDVAVPPTPNFGLAGLPRGLTSLGGYGAAELLLLPDGSRDQNQVSQERMLDVTLKKNVDQRFVPRADIAAPSDHRLVMVGGRPGWLTTGGGGRFLTIAVKRGVILSFRAPATLSESVFLRFAAGVTILPAAQAFDESA